GDYGKHIYIDHGNGMTTRYAHCSEVMVKAGQYVRQGQLIAKVGQTGRAYGAHLHFEIRINGKVMNPADYIGEVYPG
ncbi:MAG: M23 family metallopeptidase, partial [Angelakisella sp.]